jgi:capsular exopolysaccharide synthesis family protein
METLKACQRILNSALSGGNGEKSLSSLLFSSSNPGEGVSPIVASMGEFLSKYRQMKVCLVDGSLHNPSLHKIFDLENHMGLVDAAKNPDILPDIIQPTDIPKLSVVTSGNCNSRHMEELQQEDIQPIVAELKKKFDMLVFDSSAVSKNPHPLNIAPHVDGIILVIHAGRTRWEVIQDAKDQFSLVHGNFLGVVLNRRKFFIPNFIYKNL